MCHLNVLTSRLWVKGGDMPQHPPCKVDAIPIPVATSISTLSQAEGDEVRDEVHLLSKGAKSFKSSRRLIKGAARSKRKARGPQVEEKRCVLWRALAARPPCCVVEALAGFWHHSPYCDTPVVEGQWDDHICGKCNSKLEVNRDPELP